MSRKFAGRVGLPRDDRPAWAMQPRSGLFKKIDHVFITGGRKDALDNSIGVLLITIQYGFRPFCISSERRPALR